MPRLSKPASWALLSTRPEEALARPSVSPRLSEPETSDSPPPAPTDSTPLDVVVRVASSASEPEALSVAPASTVIVPCDESAVARLTWSRPEFAARTMAPDAAPGPPTLKSCETEGRAPAPSTTLPARTVMLSVAARITSGAFSSWPALLATTMSLAWGVTTRPPAPVLRTPPIRRLASSRLRLDESICR